MTTATPPGSPPGAAAREVELKLHVDPRDLARVATLPVLRDMTDGVPVSRRLRTVYFDTPDLRLAANGVALRVRRQGRQSIQALKTMAGENPGDSAAVAIRREWEWPLAGDTPDLSLLEAEGIGALIPDDLRSALAPVFVTDFQRTGLILRPDPGTEVELAVDDGDIVAGTAKERISEIELELKAGRVGRLFDLALAIQRFVPVRIGTENKAEVGYRLVTGRTPRPAPPEPLGLSPMTTVAEALRHIVRHGIRQMLANEACALAGGDAEGLHQVRVALRRLRVALRLFAQGIESEETAAIRKEIRWLDDRLRPAREWDVLLNGLLPAFAAASANPPGTTEPLADAIREARRGPAATAVEALSGARSSRFLLTLGAWLEEGAWYTRADAERRLLLDRPLAEASAAWLTRLHARVRKAGRTIDAADAAAMDRLRRRLRKLRYAVDFVRGVCPPGPTRAFAGSMEPLLDTLDRLHDVAVSQGLLAALGNDAPDRRAAATAAARWMARDADRQRRAVPDLWRAFRDTPPFWT